MSWLSLLTWPLGKLAKIGAALWRWLTADFRRLAIAALLLALGLAHHAGNEAREDLVAERAEAARWEKSARAWQDAHDGLAERTRQARLAAAEADRHNAERVERELAAITERTADDYQDRLADSRAALERVRRDLAAATRADPGGGGAAHLPGAYTARCRALGAADCDALLAALPDTLSAAEENTAKLIGLQDWALSMLAVDYSGDGPSASSSAAVGNKAPSGSAAAGPPG